MPEIVANEIAWHLSQEAHDDLASDRATLGEEGYAKERQAIQEFLCAYFSSVGDCSRKLGKSISPMGTNADGGKIMKVRWMRPGGGKSGGNRCVVVAYCERRKVVLCRALARNADPSKADVADAASLARAQHPGRKR